MLKHTRAPYELILVDNASTDGTVEYLASVASEVNHRDTEAQRRVVVIRNETNRGFAAGCNQGLGRARGEYLVLLNNDTVVTPNWLEGLIALALADWPKIGMTGPVTSWAAAPQQVAIDYRSLDGLDAFAGRRAARRQW